MYLNLVAVLSGMFQVALDVCLTFPLKIFSES